jgi:hypothetical protein
MQRVRYYRIFGSKEKQLFGFVQMVLHEARASNEGVP